MGRPADLDSSSAERQKLITPITDNNPPRYMKILIENITENPVSLLRRAGYVFQRTEGGEQSFIRTFSQSGYPRFHCYTSVTGLNLTVNLHLDQKKHTYGEGTRHHGEYENTGPVKEETARLLHLLGKNAKII